MAHEPRVAGLNDETSAPVGAAMSLGGDTDALAKYYAQWASNYDADLGTDEIYGLPASMVTTVAAAAEHVPAIADPSTPILDAGCGTGRVGAALAAHGYRVIDGIDLSPEMTAIAEARGIYRSLEAGVDLTQPPPARWRRSAELVVIGGVFTVGHIPPSSLMHVAELVAPGGVLVVSVRPGYFDTTDFADVSETLCSRDGVELVARFDELPYTDDSHGLYFAYHLTA